MTKSTQRALRRLAERRSRPERERLDADWLAIAIEALSRRSDWKELPRGVQRAMIRRYIKEQRMR